MSKGVKSFFDSHFHKYVDKPDFYSIIAREIQSVYSNARNLKLLDVGCGDGRFIRALVNEGIKGDYVATDLSYNMLSEATVNLKGYDVKLFLADGFELPLTDSVKFDVIHIDSVLHHLIGRTRGESMNLVDKMLNVTYWQAFSEWYFDSRRVLLFLTYYSDNNLISNFLWLETD